MPEVEIRERGNNLVIRVLSDAETLEEASTLVAHVGDRFADSRAATWSWKRRPPWIARTSVGT